ncbi:MAG: hypothetical protein ACE5H1_09045, partial [Thermodesulfobacteriota bacterium]
VTTIDGIIGYGFPYRNYILPYIAFRVPKQCDTCVTIQYVINFSSLLPPSDLLQISKHSKCNIQE